MNNVYTIPSINVQTSVAKVWHLADDTSIVSVHPPTHQSIKMFAKEKTIHPFSYKCGREGMDTDTVQLGEIKTVHEQANYTNAILNTIVAELNQLSAKKEAAKKDMANSSTKPTSSFTESISKPFVKLNSILTSMVESLSKPKRPNHNLLQRISEQIEAIDKRKALACLDKTCQQKVDSTSSSFEGEEATSTSNDSEEVIATIQKTFKEEEPIQNTDKKRLLALNKIKNWSNIRIRNYYLRLTPLDIQYKERGQFKDRNFNKRSI